MANPLKKIFLKINSSIIVGKEATIVVGKDRLVITKQKIESLK